MLQIDTIHHTKTFEKLPLVKSPVLCKQILLWKNTELIKNSYLLYIE